MSSFDESKGYIGNIIERDETGKERVIYYNEPIIYDSDEDKFRKYKDHIAYIIPVIFQSDKYSFEEIKHMKKMAMDTLISYNSNDNLYIDINSIEEFNNKSSEPLYLQEYINTNTEFIEKIAYEYGFNTLNTIINMDGAEIDSIEVVVTGEKNMDKCMELKLELSELYELDLSQIKVYWRKMWIY